jgi:uncharacterized membrane protein YvbJ
MAYCSKCGNKNEDDAKFCSKCGASLDASVKDRKKDHDDRCEEECAVGQHSPYAPIFWGLIVIIVGLWIIFSVVLSKFENNLPSWLSWLVGFDFWWIIGILIAIAFIVTGIRIMAKK